MPAHLRVGNITLDCDNALKLAEFWAAALGRTIDPGGNEYFASIGGKDPERTQPAWYFEKVPEPKQAKNRMHVDFVDQDPAGVERLVELGATVVARHQMGDHGWTVLQDPEGNEFCIAAKSFTG